MRMRRWSNMRHCGHEQLRPDPTNRLLQMSRNSNDRDFVANNNNAMGLFENHHGENPPQGIERRLHKKSLTSRLIPQPRSS
mmetsp:Transcript_25789/g.71048  ORF Transcript_25789/g.71048 Transcript_25789/m.71048 type:complete len:81 (-) Transcript_25789:457-699(-)